MGEGEECGDVLEAVAVTVMQVRRDRWWWFPLGWKGGGGER